MHVLYNINVQYVSQHLQFYSAAAITNLYQ